MPVGNPTSVWMNLDNCLQFFYMVQCHLCIYDQYILTLTISMWINCNKGDKTFNIRHQVPTSGRRIQNKQAKPKFTLVYLGLLLVFSFLKTYMTLCLYCFITHVTQGSAHPQSRKRPPEDGIVLNVHLIYLLMTIGYFKNRNSEMIGHVRKHPKTLLYVRVIVWFRTFSQKM